jgi:acetyltransferase
VRLRYLHPFKLDERTAHERLIRTCFVDYDREMALVAEARRASASGEIAAVGRSAAIATAATAPSSRCWSAIAGRGAGSAARC